MNFSSSPRRHDVVIAGAGPVGLFLACELALARLDVLVLEAADGADAPLKSPPLGVRGLSVATAEALDRRGLLDDLLDATATAGLPRKSQVGHFAGIPIDPALVDPSRWTYRLPSLASTNFAADMASIEAVLAARAVALGVEIRRGLAVTGVDECDHDDVIVHAGPHAFRGRWLVGCDGGRSAVRKLAGFEFVGTEPEFTAYYAVVDIADPDKLRPGRNATPSGFYMNTPGQLSIADFDGGAFDRSRPITAAHLQAVLRRVSETDVTLASMRLATSFTDRARLATTYRRGRVLLAGDAAHVHSALGGQGLNAGLGDAMNLGWKLAATVRAGAPAGLLDSYHAERHPIGQWVLDWTRAQAAVMTPSPQGAALAGIVRDLAATRDGATYFAGQLWGVSLRHDLGGTHPLIGRSAPDITFDDGGRLATQLRNGAGVLVDFGMGESLRRAIEPWRDRVRYRVGAAHDALGMAAMLVRPDGFVAWASDRTPVDGEVAAVAARWFDSGDPAP